MKKEHITHQPDDKDAWVCVCGNTPTSQGFYPCDDKGNEVEPLADWPGLYFCDRCGRIIDAKTLEVVGQRSKSRKPKTKTAR